MSEPVTWLVLEEFQKAVKLVQVSRGFHTDLGLGVVALEGDQLPEEVGEHTVILATDMPTDDGAASSIKTAMDVVIEFSVPVDADHAQRNAHRARADIVRAVIGLRRRIKDLPFKLNSIAIVGSRIGQPEDGAATVIAQVTARAGLTESLSPASP